MISWLCQVRVLPQERQSSWPADRAHHLHLLPGPQVVFGTLVLSSWRLQVGGQRLQPGLYRAGRDAAPGGDAGEAGGRRLPGAAGQGQRPGELATYYLMSG